MRPALCLSAALLAASAALAAIPEGYYDSLEGLKKSDLKRAAKNCVRNHTAISYGNSTWEAFESTDTRIVGGKVAWWDMYSPHVVYVCQGHSDMNIQHSLRNSWLEGTKND